MPRQRLGKVLGGLSLSCSSRALGGPPKSHVDGTHEGAVAPVRERSNDEAGTVAQVLVTVLDLGIHDAHHCCVPPLAVGVFFPVGAQLGLPVESGVAGNLFADQLGNDVAGVHVHHYQGAECPALHAGQLTPHHMNNVQEIIRKLLLVLLRRSGLECCSHLLCPVHCRHDKHNHPRPANDPIFAVGLSVSVDPAACDVVDRLEHSAFDLQEPLFHSPVGLLRLDLVLHGNFLPFHGYHVRDDQVFGEREPVDTLEALLQVRLDAGGVLGFRQDLQHLVVGEEEETGEEQTLLLQVGRKALLDEVQSVVALNQLLELIAILGSVQDVGGLRRELHQITPRVVHEAEFLAFGGHLFDNVLAAEDGLQVEPCALTLEPVVEQVLQRAQGAFQIRHPVLERLGERRGAHCLHLDDLVVQNILDLVCPAQDEGPCLLVRHAVELLTDPFVLHLLEGVEERELFGGNHADVLQSFQVVHHPVLDEVVDAEGHILVVGLLNNLEDLLPVARLQRRVRELL